MVLKLNKNIIMVVAAATLLASMIASSNQDQGVPTNMFAKQGRVLKETNWEQNSKKLYKCYLVTEFKEPTNKEQHKYRVEQYGKAEADKLKLQEENNTLNFNYLTGRRKRAPKAFMKYSELIQMQEMLNGPKSQVYHLQKRQALHIGDKVPYLVLPATDEVPNQKLDWKLQALEFGMVPNNRDQFHTLNHQLNDLSLEDFKREFGCPSEKIHLEQNSESRYCKDSD